MRQVTQGAILLKDIPDELTSIRALSRLVEAAVHGLWKDKIEPRKALALGTLAKHLRDLILDCELEERVARLETALEKTNEPL